MSIETIGETRLVVAQSESVAVAEVAYRQRGVRTAVETLFTFVTLRLPLQNHLIASKVLVDSSRTS